MKSRPSLFYGAFFLILAALLSLWTLLFRQAAGFTFVHREFQPSPASFVLLTALLFVLLIAAWVLYGKAVASLFGQDAAAVRAADFLSFLPLIFLSLAPLALLHYIDAGDLRARLGLFLLAAIVAVLYLKAAAIGRWAAAADVRPWRKWSRAFQAQSPRRRLAVLFVAALVAFNAGSLILISRGASFSGDEPHYLLITRSLLRDGDFDLANNYAQKDYAEYMTVRGEIAPHVVTGAKPGSLYSFHSPGVSFLLLPFYALGSMLKGKAFVAMIRLGMSIWGALFAVQVYLLARSLWGKGGLAFGLWLLASLSSPVFFYAIHVYPEIVVACLTLTAYRLLRFSPSLTAARAAACGLFLGGMIWFHALKYIALLLPLYLYGLWVVRRKSASRLGLLLYVLVPATVIVLYLQFQHALYGTYSPFAISWAQPVTGTQKETLRFAGSALFGIPLRDRLETLAGYFLDQRDGLLFYAPLYFFSFLGIWEMLKKKRGELLLLLFLSAPYVLLSASLTQRTGYAPPARPLVAVIWIMIVGLGYFLSENRRTIFAYLQNFAAAASLAFVALLLSQPLNLYMETTRGATDRGGGLFYQLSNLHFNLTSLLPSYLKVENRGWLPNLVWPALIFLFVLVYALSGKRAVRPRYFVHVGAACAGVAVFFLWFALYPRPVLINPTGVAYPSGDRVVFYSLSRSARRTEAGQFFLREDGRSYRFYFATDRPIEELGLVFGSDYGEYPCAIRLFDEPLLKREASPEVQSLRLTRPPRYQLGRRSLYGIILELGKGTVATSDRTPYRFAIEIKEAPG